MKINCKLTLVAFVAFFCGVFTQSHIPAKSYADTYRTKSGRKIKKYYGKASWYSEQSPGIRKRTANNEVFNDRRMTCAMWNVPFGQKIRVTNVATGKSVVVRVNDRGPHKRYVRKGRIIDLTKNAFRKIAPLKNGLVEVELEFL